MVSDRLAPSTQELQGQNHRSGYSLDLDAFRLKHQGSGATRGQRGPTSCAQGRPLGLCKAEGRAEGKT